MIQKFKRYLLEYAATYGFAIFMMIVAFSMWISEEEE